MKKMIIVLSLVSVPMCFAADRFAHTESEKETALGIINAAANMLTDEAVGQIGGVSDEMKAFKDQTSLCNAQLKGGQEWFWFGSEQPSIFMKWNKPFQQGMPKSFQFEFQLKELQEITCLNRMRTEAPYNMKMVYWVVERVLRGESRAPIKEANMVIAAFRGIYRFLRGSCDCCKDVELPADY